MKNFIKAKIVALIMWAMKNEIERMQSTSVKRLSDQLDDLGNEFNELKDENSFAERDYKEMKRKCEKLEERIDSLNEFDEDDFERRFEKLDDKVETIEHDFENLKDDVENSMADKIDTMEDEIEALQEKVENIDEKESSINPDDIVQLIERVNELELALSVYQMSDLPHEMTTFVTSLKGMIERVEKKKAE